MCSRPVRPERLRQPAPRLVCVRETGTNQHYCKSAPRTIEPAAKPQVHDVAQRHCRRWWDGNGASSAKSSVPSILRSHWRHGPRPHNQDSLTHYRRQPGQRMPLPRSCFVSPRTCVEPTYLPSALLNTILRMDLSARRNTANPFRLLRSP